MKVRWTRPALIDFVEAQAYVAKDNPQAARVIAQRLWDATRALADHPQIGRAGHASGTREWVVAHTPFLIVYRLRDETVEILRLWHARRDWQSEPDAG